MSIIKQISFKVDSDLRVLEQLLGDFEQLNQPWISKKDWLQCQLALAEGFTNAVRHAHKDLPPEVFIEIDIRLTSESLEIRIWDSGPFFDLQGFLQTSEKSDNRLASNGHGLAILQKIAAQLSYSRTDDQRNCLLIVKNFSAP